MQFVGSVGERFLAVGVFVRLLAKPGFCLLHRSVHLGGSIGEVGDRFALRGARIGGRILLHLRGSFLHLRCSIVQRCRSRFGDCGERRRGLLGFAGKIFLVSRIGISGGELSLMLN